MKRFHRNIPEVDSSSATAIVFLLLIFFIAITSTNADEGLERRLPPPIGKYTPIKVAPRNILNVCLTDRDELICGNQTVGIGELRYLTKLFIANPKNDVKLPEKINKEIPSFGKVAVTARHVISVQCGRLTTYQAYIDVQNELIAAYNELREALAEKKWRRKYAQLTDEQQSAVCAYYPMCISEAEPQSEGGKK